MCRDHTDGILCHELFDRLSCEGTVDAEPFRQHRRGNKLVLGDLLVELIVGILVEKDEVIRLLLHLRALIEYTMKTSDVVSILTHFTLPSSPHYLSFSTFKYTQLYAALTKSSPTLPQRNAPYRPKLIPCPSSKYKTNLNIITVRTTKRGTCSTTYLSLRPLLLLRSLAGLRSRLSCRSSLVLLILSLCFRWHLFSKQYYLKSTPQAITFTSPAVPFSSHASKDKSSSVLPSDDRLSQLSEHPRKT